MRRNFRLFSQEASHRSGHGQRTAPQRGPTTPVEQPLHGRIISLWQVLTGLPQQTRHFRQQGRHIQRFAGKTLHTGIQRSLAITIQHTGGQGDDRYRPAALGLFTGANLPGGLQAVHTGHLDIHENQVDRFCGTGGYRSRPFADTSYLVPETLQIEL